MTECGAATNLVLLHTPGGIAVNAGDSGRVLRGCGRKPVCAPAGFSRVEGAGCGQTTRPRRTLYATSRCCGGRGRALLLPCRHARAGIYIGQAGLPGAHIRAVEPRRLRHSTCTWKKLAIRCSGCREGLTVGRPIIRTLARRPGCVRVFLVSRICSCCTARGHGAAPGRSSRPQLPFL